MRASEEIKKGSTVWGTSGGLNPVLGSKKGGRHPDIQTETESTEILQPMSIGPNGDHGEARDIGEVLATPTQDSIPSPDIRQAHGDMAKEVLPGKLTPPQSRLAHLDRVARGLVDKVADEVSSAMLSSELSRSPRIFFQ